MKNLTTRTRRWKPRTNQIILWNTFTFCIFTRTYTFVDVFQLWTSPYLPLIWMQRSIAPAVFFPLSPSPFVFFFHRPLMNGPLWWVLKVLKMLIVLCSLLMGKKQEMSNIYLSAEKWVNLGSQVPPDWWQNDGGRSCDWVMRPEWRDRKSSHRLADRSKTSELGNMGCETPQYVQTEWMSPTLRVPRHFPSHKSIHTSTCSHTDLQPQSLCQCGFLSAFHRPGFNESNAQASCATVKHYFSTGSTRQALPCAMWKLLEKAGKLGNQIKVSWRRDVLNTSLGDAPCPAGCEVRTLHTYSHKSFTLSLCFCPPIHTHNRTLHTDAQPDALGLVRRSSHIQYLPYTYWKTEWKLK